MKMKYHRRSILTIITIIIITIITITIVITIIITITTTTTTEAKTKILNISSCSTSDKMTYSVFDQLFDVWEFQVFG
jgi:hypothetical protein